MKVFPLFSPYPFLMKKSIESVSYIINPDILALSYEEFQLLSDLLESKGGLRNYRSEQDLNNRRIIYHLNINKENR